MSMSFTKIGRSLFYVFVFLLPLFYISNPFVSMEFNKMVFLLPFLSIITIFAILGIFKEGKLELRGGLVSLGITIFLLMAAISTIFFSINPSNSFFGESGSANSLISYLLYGGIFFTGLTLIKEKRHVQRIGLFLISSISILTLGFLGRVLIGGEINLPLTSINILALLNAVGMVMLFFLSKEEENPTIKGLLGLAFFILGAGLILINFNTAWFILAVASFLMFWVLILVNSFKKQNFILLLVTIVSVVLFFFSPNLPFDKGEDAQVLGFGESVNIAQQSTFLGSGIASFDESFLKHNPTKLQNGVYYESSSVAFTILNDFGVIGFILFFIPFGYLAIKGSKKFLLSKSDFYEKMSFVFFFTLFLLLFFYGFDLILMSLLFLSAALLVTFLEKRKEISFKNMNSNVIVLILGLLALLLMAIIVLNYFYYQDYLAESYYGKAIEIHSEDRSKGIEYLEKSNGYIEKEKTLIGLSQLYLLKASDLYTQSKLLETKEEDRTTIMEECESFMALSESKAVRATEISPSDYYTWINLGNIYNNRRYLRDEPVEEKVIDSYTKASELAPNNKAAFSALVQIYSELGNVEMREVYLEKINLIEAE